MRNEGVVHRVKEEKNVQHTMKRRKPKCIGNILPYKTRYSRKNRCNEKTRKRRKQLLGSLAIKQYKVKAQSK